MKKCLLLLFFILFSCSNHIYLLHESYYKIGQPAEIKKDIYYEINKRGADSIPLKDWLYIGEDESEDHYRKRIYSHVIDKKTEEVYVLTTYEYADSFYYSFKIYLKTKNKPEDK